MKRISVIGQGYVGLPLAVDAARASYEVSGIDLDLNKIKSLAAGNSYIEDIPNSQLKDLIVSGKYIPTNSFTYIANSDVIVICVPTPLDDLKQPNLSHISHSLIEILKYMKKDALVVLESTVAPGTTRNLIGDKIASTLKIAQDELLVAYSPERIDPMNKVWRIKNTPKIIAGINQKSLNKAREFYSKFVDEIHSCESLEIAETAKLLENSFRLVNISLINEISKFCSATKIDVTKVIEAAATKPYGFMEFSPSIGVGGHCIPVDPIYLAAASHAVGEPINLIDKAIEVNNDLPRYFVARAEKILGDLRDKRILIIGVAYKPNVSDVRESAVEPLINKFKLKKANVSWHDDLVKEWNGEISTALSKDFDLAILATPHQYLDLSSLGDVPIIDSRGSI